jgi:glutamine amidotransferase
MCELMALNSEHPITADFSFREFGGRDQQNADGWGLAWYTDQSASLIKEPVSWRASAHTGFLETYRALRSTIFVAHVRHRTMGGEPTHADTHPFLRELNAREYVFMHNGTLTDLPRQSSICRFQPLGATDSENAFCYLVERLAARGGSLSTLADFEWLHAELKRLNAFGKLNCILSDGFTLFCYRDDQERGGLEWCPLRLPAHHSERTISGRRDLRDPVPCRLSASGFSSRVVAR